MVHITTQPSRNRSPVETALESSTWISPLVMVITAPIKALTIPRPISRLILSRKNRAEARATTAGVKAINTALRTAVTVRKPEKRKKLNIITPVKLRSTSSRADLREGLGNPPSRAYRKGSKNRLTARKRRKAVVKGGRFGATTLPATNAPPHRIGTKKSFT